MDSWEGSHGVRKQSPLWEEEQPGTTRKMRGLSSGVGDGADCGPHACSLLSLAAADGHQERLHTAWECVLDSS